MERRRTLLYLLALLILLCGFADSGGRARMAGYESTGNPQVHVKPIVALPGISATFAGVANIWPFSCTNVWVEGSNQTPAMDEQFQQVTQHFDGSKWTSYLPTGIKYDPIVSNSTTNTWAFGGSTVGGHGYEVNTVSLDHFDGHEWKIVVSGDPGYLHMGPMAVAGNDFWYISTLLNYQGYHLSIHHYSPLSGWNDITSTGLPVTNDLQRMVVVSSINMWVTTGDGRIFHYNGLSWNETPIEPQLSLAGLSATSSTDAWVGAMNAANEAIVEHWDGKIWRMVPLAKYTPHGTYNQVRHLFAFSRNDAWALINSSAQGPLFFEHWNGSKWILYTTPQYLAQYEIAPLWKEHALGVVTGNSTSQVLVALTP